MKSTIYKIVCSNGREYIGQTKDFESRKYMHLWKLNNGEHVNKDLQMDFDKLGIDAFTFSKIMKSDNPDHDERKLISDSNNVYNSGLIITAESSEEYTKLYHALPEVVERQKNWVKDNPDKIKVSSKKSRDRFKSTTKYRQANMYHNGWRRCINKIYKQLSDHKQGIILEGINQSGKSTLGAELSKYLYTSYKHSGQAPKDSFEIMENCLEQVTWLSNGFIVDRITPISNVAYNLYDIRDNDLRKLRDLRDDICNEFTVIYCVHSLTPINKPEYPKGHFKHISDNYNNIKDMYDTIMSTIPHIRYDHTDMSFKDIIEEIERCK